MCRPARNEIDRNIRIAMRLGLIDGTGMVHDKVNLDDIMRKAVGKVEKDIHKAAEHLPEVYGIFPPVENDGQND
jgi:hypothetical protein